MMYTLPERLLTARQSSMPHVDFLETVLADEVARRDARSAQVRAKAAPGHIGCRRRYRVHYERADKLFKRMKAARLD